ncbi:hypothetical protein BDU57DRAFT_565218 [Ampelomyces quisqualis]|uniref:Uncharacterized protein n=1 Tax=Ampelomyces quisqualis TaxID=50730 RepID=A0A6A5QBD8_AMPQU|nr:hypothetical protein BDU57DRAFT_565218 [Ampelomyces quisqualis]
MPHAIGHPGLPLSPTASPRVAARGSHAAGRLHPRPPCTAQRAPPTTPCARARPLRVQQHAARRPRTTPPACATWRAAATPRLVRARRGRLLPCTPYPACSLACTRPPRLHPHSHARPSPHQHSTADGERSGIPQAQSLSAKSSRMGHACTRWKYTSTRLCYAPQLMADHNGERPGTCAFHVVHQKPYPSRARLLQCRVSQCLAARYSVLADRDSLCKVR